MLGALLIALYSNTHILFQYGIAEDVIMLIYFTNLSHMDCILIIVQIGFFSLFLIFENIVLSIIYFDYQGFLYSLKFPHPK